MGQNAAKILSVNLALPEWQAAFNVLFPISVSAAWPGPSRAPEKFAREGVGVSIRGCLLVLGVFALKNLRHRARLKSGAGRSLPFGVILSARAKTNQQTNRARAFSFCCVLVAAAIFSRNRFCAWTAGR